MSECECSEEYGPCEDHAETLVVREGASCRTADEVQLQLCTDLADLITGEGRALPEGVAATLELWWEQCEDRRHMGVSWFTDNDDDNAVVSFDELIDMSDKLSGELPDLQIWQEDGYRITRLTGGPLAEETTQ